MAEVLTALQAPPDRREVARWEEALTAYRATMAGLPRISSRPRSRRPRPIASPRSVKLAAAAGATVITVFGGGIAAAYTGSLPAALQKFAHTTIAAPGVPSNPAATPGLTGHPVGPSVTGGAAYGLCNAYQNADEHGTVSERSVAFRNLVKAAGGADKVAAYCAAVPHPGTTTPPGRRVGQTGSPTTAASHGQKPSTPPGRPSTPPGRPSTPPGRPSTPPGKPSTPPGHGNGGG